MNDITKEQIIRLENVGLAVADSISDEYSALKKSFTDNREKINKLYSDFSRITGEMNEEDINNAG